MTCVTFYQEKAHYISLLANGHADFASKGNDTICAGISAILFGFANALDALTVNKQIVIKGNSFKITCSTYNDISDAYFQCVYIQLKTIEEAYPQNLKIELLERRPNEV